MENLSMQKREEIEFIFDQASYDLGRKNWHKTVFEGYASPESAKLGAELYFLNISNATHRTNVCLINGIDDTYVEHSPLALLGNTQTLAEFYKKYSNTMPEKIKQEIILMAKGNLEALLSKFGNDKNPIQQKLLPLKLFLETSI